MAKKQSGFTARSVGSLNRQFHKLSASCIKADQNYVAAADKIDAVLVRAYMLYLELARKRTVLAKIYKKAGVKRSPRTDGSKFTPFVKVLFRLALPKPSAADKKRHQLAPKTIRNRVSEYAAVLDKLDAAHSARPKDFQRQPEAKYKKVIEDGGGIRGAVQARAEQRRQLSGNVAKSAYDDEVVTSKVWIADNALPLLKKTTIISPPSFFKQSGIRFNATGLAAVVISKDENGNISFGPASNNNDALQLIAEDEVVKLNRIGDPSLRLLAEAVATQTYPSKYCPDGSRADPASRYRKWDGEVCAAQGEPMERRRRLVVRQDIILLSAVAADTSVVTILKPAQRLLSKGDFDVCLDADQLLDIEDWIETNTIVARTASPSAGLGNPANDNRVLEVKNEATGKIRKLIFRRVRSAGKPATDHQVDLDLSKFQPTWEFTAERDWFWKLRSKCLDEWFGITASRNKLQRPAHWLFHIEVTKTKFIIGYELDDTAVHPKDEIDLGGTDSTAATLKGARASFHVSAKDMAPVLYNIADRDIEGSATVSGDDDMILLKFRTGRDEYFIATPTATSSKKGVARNGKRHMPAYPSA